MAFGIDDGIVIVVVLALIFFFGRKQVREWAKDIGGAVHDFSDARNGKIEETKQE